MATKSKQPVSKKKPWITGRVETMSPTQPIPFEGGKGFSYLNDTEFLPFLPPEDRYARLLLQARLLSVTGNACVTTKRDFCAGEGFQTSKEDEITNVRFNEWCKAVNSKNNPLTEVNRQIFESHFTFGNTPIELIRFIYKGKKYFYICPHNMLEWRLCMPNKDDGIIYSAISSKLFMQDEFVFTHEDYLKSVRLPIYDPKRGNKKASKYRDGINWLVDSNGVERTLIWYKQSSSGFSHYGLPSNSASIPYEILEYKSARFGIDEFENNMVLGGILALKGAITESELTKISKRIINTHTGDGKRGRVLAVGSEEGIDGSDYHQFNSKKEASYQDAAMTWAQNIILANKWDAVLAGLVLASTMNKGVSFLAKVLEIKKNTVIIPEQKALMEGFWIPALTIANEWMGWGLNVEDLQIKNTIDISGITDVDITPVVTVDEVREAKGLPAVGGKKGKMMLGELGAEQKKGVYVKESGTKKSTEEDAI